MSVRRQRSGRVGADHARRALSCAVALVDGFEGGQAAHWRRWVASASYLRGGEWRRTDDELRCRLSRHAACTPHAVEPACVHDQGKEGPVKREE
jgi:hypothetical protein